MVDVLDPMACSRQASREALHRRSVKPQLLLVKARSVDGVAKEQIVFNECNIHSFITNAGVMLKQLVRKHDEFGFDHH